MKVQSVKMRYIVVGVLVISLLSNFVLSIYTIYGKQKKPIIGTYCTGNGLEETDKYIVFERTGVYNIYRQFQTYEKGTYKAEGEDNVYMLSSSGNMYLKYIVYNGKDEIYIYNYVESGIEVYKRISNQPIYINTNLPEE